MKKNMLFVTIGIVVALVAALDVSPALATYPGEIGPLYGGSSAVTGSHISMRNKEVAHYGDAGEIGDSSIAWFVELVEQRHAAVVTQEREDLPCGSG